jgi:TonB-dependent SusC/RagA subfamily outer membrane receptor
MKIHYSLIVVMLVISQVVCAQNDTIRGVLLDVNNKEIKNYPVTLGRHSPITVKTDKKGVFTFIHANLRDTLFVGDKKGRNLVAIPVKGHHFLYVKSLKGNFNTEYLSDEDERIIRYLQVLEKDVQRKDLTSLRREDIEISGCNEITCLLRMLRSVTVSGNIIRVRGGAGSLSSASSTSALIVIDGIPEADINSVEVYDIENISVLTDASIYGVRGANGAIVINMRKK